MKAEQGIYNVQIVPPRGEGWDSPAFKAVHGWRTEYFGFRFSHREGYTWVYSVTHVSSGYEICLVAGRAAVERFCNEADAIPNIANVLADEKANRMLSKLYIRYRDEKLAWRRDDKSPRWPAGGE